MGFRAIAVTVLASLAAFFAAPAGSGAATSITVSSEADSGTGSLRMALAGAPPGTTILIPGGFTIKLATPLTIEQTAPGVTIAATGSGSPTISGTFTTGLFKTNSNTVLNLDGITLAEGDGGGDGNAIAMGSGATVNVDRGTLRDNGSGGTSGDGGAIAVENGGTLTIRHSTLIGNHGGTATGNGGAIHANQNSTVTIDSSTLSGNHAGPASGYGGAIQMNSGSTLAITDSTLAENKAGEVGYGGAIETETGVPTTLLNDTFAGNRAARGGAIFTAGLGAIAKNTILSGNAAQIGPNCGGNTAPPIASAGHNLEQGTSCGLTGGGDLNADPLLGYLADNGGPTATMALLAGSSAIDAGDASGCPATDQRGMPRPDNGESACDIGAYEFQDPLVPLRVASGFEVSRRGRCRGRCRTIVLKGRFDSPGKVLVSEFTRIRPGVAVRKLPPRFVRPLAQTVHPGSNALRLRTRPKARRKLLRTGRLKLKLQLQYLPTGGAANSAVQAVNVKRVKKTPR